MPTYYTDPVEKGEINLNEYAKRCVQAFVLTTVLEESTHHDKWLAETREALNALRAVRYKPEEVKKLWEKARDENETWCTKAIKKQLIVNDRIATMKHAIQNFVEDSGGVHSDYQAFFEFLHEQLDMSYSTTEHLQNDIDKFPADPQTWYAIKLENLEKVEEQDVQRALEARRNRANRQQWFHGLCDLFGWDPATVKLGER